MTAVLLTVVLMLVGVALIAVEVVLIPGIGLVGLLGLAATAGAVLVAYTMLGPVAAGATVGVAVVATGAAFYFLPKTKIGKSMVLETSTGGHAGDPALASLLGVEGRAITPLRPSGTAELGGAPVDVVTDGAYIDAGATVRVILVRGNRVVVEASGVAPS